MPYLSASAVVIHYEEALYQVYGPLPLPFTMDLSDLRGKHVNVWVADSAVEKNSEVSNQGQAREKYGGSPSILHTAYTNPFILYNSTINQHLGQIVLEGKILLQTKVYAL